MKDTKHIRWDFNSDVWVMPQRWDFWALGVPRGSRKSSNIVMWHIKLTGMTSRTDIVCACAILKDRPVCYGTSRLKNRVCAVMRCALLKTPTLKSNKREMPIDNPSLEISSHIG